jgi:hypothetical protein
MGRVNPHLLLFHRAYRLADFECFLGDFLPTALILRGNCLLIPFTGENIFERNCQRLRIAVAESNPASVFDQFGDAPHPGGDHGTAAAQGFDNHVRTSFGVARQTENIAAAIQRATPAEPHTPAYMIWPETSN